MGLFNKAANPNELIMLANAIYGIRPWMEPQVKQRFDGLFSLSVRTNPLDGQILMKRKSGWFAVAARRDEDGDMIPFGVAATPFGNARTPIPHVAAFVMMVCRVDLERFIEMAQNPIFEIPENEVAWARDEVAALAREGWA